MPILVKVLYICIGNSPAQLNLYFFMEHFYLVSYCSETYQNLVICETLNDVCRLELSTPDGSNIYSVHCYLIEREIPSEVILSRFDKLFGHKAL